MPAQAAPGAQPGPWPAGSSAPPAGGWPFGFGSFGQAGTPQGTRETASIALSQLHEQAETLASAAEDLANASVAMREKNQEQVREILQSSARKLAKVSQAWQAAMNAPGTKTPSGNRSSSAPSPKAGADGSVFTPLSVPATEPTAPEERKALEETIRARLKLLKEPYTTLANREEDVAQVRELLQACREALSQGALRSAATSLNAAMQMMQHLLLDKTEQATK